MADHIYPPDYYGNFDDWSDFSVSLVDEELEAHKIVPAEMLFLHESNHMPKLRANPSSVWKDDLLEQSIKTDIARNNQLNHNQNNLTSLENLKQSVKQNVNKTKETTEQTLHELSDSTKSAADQLNIKAEEGAEKVKQRIKDISKEAKAAEKDLGNKVKEKEEKVAAKTEGTLEKLENSVKSAGSTVKEELNKLTDKTEQGVEIVKEKLEEGWNKTKNVVSSTKNEVGKEVKDLDNKAKSELNNVSGELRQGVDKVKEKLSTQKPSTEKPEPEITVIPEVIVVVEEWEKPRENEGFFSRWFGSSKKLETSCEIPPKELDASHNLDMVGAKREKVDSTTTTNQVQSGGPFPPSHIPSKLRVDQGEVEHLKKFDHQGFGQIDKDLYGGNVQNHGTGNPAKSTPGGTRTN